MQNELLSGFTADSQTARSFQILAGENAAAFFDPLFLVQKQGIIGLEAVYRTLDPRRLEMIDSSDLFLSMGDRNFQAKLDLDRLFRRKGLEGFSAFQSKNPRLLLFLDIEPSILEEGTVGSGYLLQQVKELGLDPQQVVVQIPLSQNLDPKLVQRFVLLQREHQFLVSLKDIEDGSLHQEYLLRFNPDLVKLEEGLVRGLARNSGIRAKFMEAVRLAHELRIVVVAGGLDNEEDALAALELGADLLQGKYFTRRDKSGSDSTLGLKARISFLAHRFRRRLEAKANQTWGLKNRCKQIADFIFTRLQDVPASAMEKEFQLVLGEYPALECLYMLDSGGIQVSETVCSPYHIPERKRFLFQPAPKGTDHSLEEHFYALSDTRPSNVTEPYLSMNSGHLCVTISKMFLDPALGGVYHLCADLNLSKI